jgi:hypothetical protein
VAAVAGEAATARLYSGSCRFFLSWFFMPLIIQKTRAAPRFSTTNTFKPHLYFIEYTKTYKKQECSSTMPKRTE